jgi:transcription antitermination protein NusB
MKTAIDPRHQRRAEIVQQLFAASFHDTEEKLIADVWSKRDQIDIYIQKAAPEWPINKLNPMDLAILRLAVYELVIDRKEPYKVIIDEAIELAKEFGGENSPAFVNGSLGAIIKSL